MLFIVQYIIKDITINIIKFNKHFSHVLLINNYKKQYTRFLKFVSINNIYCCLNCNYNNKCFHVFNNNFHTN